VFIDSQKLMLKLPAVFSSVEIKQPYIDNILYGSKPHKPIPVTYSDLYLNWLF